MRRRRQPSTEPLVRLGPALPIPLVGREAEKKEILAAAGSVVIVAAPGMGKTALARAVTGPAWVRCLPGDTAAAVEERARRMDADRWLVDDVHLLGEQAATLLERLGRVTATSERRLPVGKNIELAPLGVGDARALWTRLEELFGPTPKDACDAALERVRGVPLAVRREYAVALLGVKRPWDIAALETVERAVLEAAAVLLGPAAPAALAFLSERRSDSAVEGALRSLSRRQLLGALADGRFEIHDVARVAVLAAMSNDDRRDLERRAAVLEGGTATPKSWDRFEATPAPVDDVLAVTAAVRHLHAAGDDDAAATRLRGSEELLVGRGACAEALALAAMLSADLVPLRARLLLRVGLVEQARALEPSDAAIKAEIALASGDLTGAEAALGRASGEAARAITARIRAERSGALPPVDEARGRDETELATRVTEARARGAELAALHVERELAERWLLRGRTGAAVELARALEKRAAERGLGALAREARLIGAAADADDFRAAEAVDAVAPLLADERARGRAACITARAAVWVGRPCPELGDDIDDQAALAEAAWAEDKIGAALERLVRAAAAAERVGRRATLARLLADAARLHHALGHRAAAENAAAGALTEGAEAGVDRAVARALLVTAALRRDAGELPGARAAADDALTIARAANLCFERYLAAGAAEALARAAGDRAGQEVLANVTRAAAATLGSVARGAADRMLAELGLASSNAFRVVTSDGASSYSPSATPALGAAERKELTIDGVNDRVLRRGKLAADLRRRTLLKRLLFLFAGAPGRLFTKEEIVSRVWRVSYHPLRHDAALFTNVMRLRRLLGENGADILRVAEGGYRFVPPSDYVFVEKL